MLFRSCIGLGWLGSKPPEGWYVIVARIFTVYYFAYFLIILPILGYVETPKPLPKSISEDVLKHKGAIAAIMLAVGLAALLGTSSPGVAAEADTPAKNKWSFAGPFGNYDRGQLQRGYKVYKEVCSTCHSMSLMHFRNLADPGGPGFSPAQAAAVAADYKVQDGPNDAGDMFDRPGRIADPFPVPFKNEQAARADPGQGLWHIDRKEGAERRGAKRDRRPHITRIDSLHDTIEGQDHERQQHVRHRN